MQLELLEVELKKVLFKFIFIYLSNMIIEAVRFLSIYDF